MVHPIVFPGDRPVASRRTTVAFPGLPAPSGTGDEPRPTRFFRGDTMELGGNRPFLLDGRQAFVVLRGEVDLFSVARSNGVAVGPRRHLQRVGTGGLLLGLGPHASPDDRGILAVATSGTVLELGTHQDLRGLLAAPGSASRAHALLEGWIEALCAGVSKGLPLDRCLDLACGEPVVVPEPTRLRSSVPVAWARIHEGCLKFLGRPELSVEEGAYLPVSSAAFLTSDEPALIELVPTDQLPDEDTLWGGLYLLARLVLQQTSLVVSELESAESERARAKAAAGAATLAKACENLAGALNARPFEQEEIDYEPPIVEASPHQAGLILGACRLVGAEMGIAIKTPPRSEGRHSLRDPLASILRSSRVRARKVALKGQWWKQDNGPLLAFVSSPGQAEAPSTPVALIRRHKAYVVQQPRVAVERVGSAGESLGPALHGRQVDGEPANQLEPFAFSLYRSFPESRLTVRALLRFGVRGSGRDIFMVILMGLLAAALGMVPSMATAHLFNEIIPGAQRSQMLQMSVLLLASALAGAGFSLARGLAVLRIRGRMGPMVQAAVWDRLLALPLRFFRPYTAGDLAVRAMAIDSIQQTLSGSTITAIMSGVFSLGNLALMFHYSPQMAWKGLVLLLIAVVVTLAAGLLQLRPERRIAGLQSRTSGLVLQLLSSIAKIRVAGAEVRAFAKWVALFAKQRRLQFISHFIENWVDAFISAFPLAATVVMYWAVLPVLEAGDMNLRTGDFLAFIATFSSCLGALLGTCGALQDALGTLPLYEQAKPILEATPEVETGKSVPGQLIGDIEMQNAVFRYQSDGPLALRGVSFRIKPGEFVAFVGASGSGKSTILKLLLGFERLETGSIYYDGQEIRLLDIHEVRRQMGVVLQNGALIAGDIFTNITGSGTATLEQAWEAARMAGFAEDIQSMPMGMHTIISDGAGTLSGGQRQRLMIARAIVHRPRILLFDEATSALDNRTQAVVSDSLMRLKSTRIVVAHRLSTIVNADRIHVVERGQIVQSGTYAELIAQQGAFADLARRQLT